MSVVVKRGDVVWWLTERRRGEISIKESVRRWVEKDRYRTGVRAKLPRRKKGSKISIYMHEETYAEVRADSRRHERSISQTLQAAWAIARTEIEKYPSRIP